MVVKICPCCGVEFEARNNAAKFCSSKCRKKSHTIKQKAAVMKYYNISKYTCKQCGKVFQAKVHRDFCCAGCEDAYAANRKERNRQNALEISRINELARKEGLTYGQYMAKYGYSNNK